VVYSFPFIMDKGAYYLTIGISGLGELSCEDPFSGGKARFADAAVCGSGGGVCELCSFSTGGFGYAESSGRDGYFSWDSGLDKKFKIT
jgi:hypothetical protein